MAKNILRFLDSGLDGELAVASEKIVRCSEKEGRQRLSAKERRLAQRRRRRKSSPRNKGLSYA